MKVLLLGSCIGAVNALYTSLRGLDTILSSQEGNSILPLFPSFKYPQMTLIPFYDTDARRGLSSGYLGNYNLEPEPALVESARK